MPKQPSKGKDPNPALVQGRDYYIDAGRYVFTAHYLLERGYCCGSGCRHCPYPPPSSCTNKEKPQP